MARYPSIKAEAGPLMGADGKTIIPNAFAKLGDFKFVGTNSLEIVNIPQYYRHLRILARIRSQRAIPNTGLRLFPNLVTGISWRGIYTNYNPVSSATYNDLGGVYCGQVPAAPDANPNSVGYITIDIPWYTEGPAKMFSAEVYFRDFNRTDVRTSGTFPSINALALRDDVSGALEPYSKATLYGIA